MLSVFLHIIFEHLLIIMKKKIYFKGLSELRAIAALLVLFHHLELYKHRNKVYSLYDTFLEEFIGYAGKNGVYVFFVLSGFLITYLLLSEKSFKGKVDIRKFYMRRILRIWPLYYFILFISFVIIPLLASNFQMFQNEYFYYRNILLFKESPYVTIVLYLLFLPNLVLSLNRIIIGASQTWSVGVEEQFYIIWPHIVNFIDNKKYLLLIFIGVVLLPYFCYGVNSINPYLGGKLFIIMNTLPINFMAMGAIGAYYLYYNENKIVKIITNKWLFILNSILFVICLVSKTEQTVFSFICLFEILFIIQPSFKINLRNRFLEKLGNISYGIYMYHITFVYIWYSIYNSVFTVENIIVYNVLVYVSTIGSTILVSHLSFKYFESWFINLKNRKYTVIKSGK